MCSRPLDTLSLDHLALLASHPRATPTVQAAFSRALLSWTRERARKLRHRWPPGVELDDVIQTFMLRCLTRHLPAWQEHRVALSPYLYRRLLCDACDVVRGQNRHASRFDDLDPDVVIDEERETEACLERVGTVYSRTVDFRRFHVVGQRIHNALVIVLERLDVARIHDARKPMA